MDRLYGQRAWVYDAAFSWDVDEEVQWLVDRFGRGVRRVLEPGCGSGRLMPAFFRLGVEVVGLDRSPEMLARARTRMEELGLPAPRLEQGDMAEFKLDVKFDGALCPINTFGYLGTFEDAAAHLRCVAAHLSPGARYLVQLDVNSIEGTQAAAESRWEATTPRGRIECRWFGESVDAGTGMQTQVSRFEVLSGPGSGQVFEDRHLMRVWNWSDWSDLIAASPLEQVAAYDGWRRPIDVGRSIEGRQLTWHELTAP